MSNAPLPRTLRDPSAPGYALFPGFADATMTGAMLEDVIDLARTAASGASTEGAIVMPEAQQGMTGTQPEDLVSKIFRLHRRPAFRRFLEDPRVQKLVVEAIGPDVDCFLSQFIFKNPGAWGQPWHQDSFYFPFTPARPVVGLWLAITEATLENGCLHILPGSQAQPVHEHIPDRRPSANQGYVEIVDHDMSNSEPCLLNAGDLMIFDSHLMHRSTDNGSDGIRAAMVYHCATAGTVDNGIERPDGRSAPSPVNDLMPYLRNGVIAGNQLEGEQDDR